MFGLATLFFCLWVFFIQIELNQGMQDIGQYLKDYWNYIDIGSAALNLVFMLFLIVDTVTVSATISTVTIRTVGALAVFFMWIKLFYWLRLFRMTAHFITLISQTIWEIRVFTLMLFVVLGAFANFFFVLNNNTPANKAN